MKKVILSVVLVIGILGSGGDAKAAVTYFDQLESYFKQGTLPADSDIVGWTSGRCFKKYYRNEPFPSVLVGWLEKLQGDAGPLFPSSSRLNFLKYEGNNMEADWFDDAQASSGTRGNAKIQEVERFLNSSSGKLNANSSVKDLTTVTAFFKYNQRNLAVRMYQKYLIAKLFTPGNTDQEYCYYFKKLQ